MKEATIDTENNIVNIKFKTSDSDDWHKTLDFIRDLPGRDFNPTTKIWTVPALEENIKALKENGFDLSGGTEKEVLADPREQYKDIDIPTELFPDLRPYQIECLRFLQWRKGRGLITDEMGTGKTVQALSYLKLHPEKRPVLIVVPASIKLQWKREFYKWTDDKNIEILSGRKTDKIYTKTSYIINWDIIKDWKRELMLVPFQIVIADEFQAIGDPSTQRSKAFRKITKNIPEFIGLSGTPIRSRPAQFFSALSLVNPVSFANRIKFLHRYCDPKFNGFGWEYKGITHEEELHKLISQVMIRRTKKEVLKDLPDKIRTVIPLEIDNSEYNEKLDQFQNTSFDTKLDQMNELKSLNYTAFDAKKDIAVKWIREFLESGEKLVVYAHHRAVVKFLKDEFNKESVKIDGSSSQIQRDDAVKRFQKDNTVRLLIGNIIAAGAGIDGLQNVCSNAAFLELIWNSTDHLQAEDRLHRFGQKDCVNIYYLIASGTIEEDMAKILDGKMKMFDAVVDGKKTDDQDLLLELMKKYKGEGE